jgi:hypothetical protein
LDKIAIIINPVSDKGNGAQFYEKIKDAPIIKNAFATCRKCKQINQEICFLKEQKIKYSTIFLDSINQRKMKLKRENVN